jgi:hypothetical protein
MYPHKKRWHGNSLDSRSTPARFTTQHLCIQYSKMNAPFSQNFNLNHRINTYTPAFCSRIKLTKNVIGNPLVFTSAGDQKNFVLKTQCFAPILQKLLFHGQCHNSLIYVGVKYCNENYISKKWYMTILLFLTRSVTG